MSGSGPLLAWVELVPQAIDTLVARYAECKETLVPIIFRVLTGTKGDILGRAVHYLVFVVKMNLPFLFGGCST